MTETSRHTLGPWEIKRKGLIIKSIGPCEPDEYQGSAWLELSDADARLIAAAPDLLKALKEVMAVLKKEAPGTSLNNHKYDGIGVAAYSAIAKAENL